MHVLIADDDRIAAAVLSRTLQQWNYDVTVVADGAEAWSHLQAAQSKGTPTLAILDWMMPHLEGADVCRRVRRELPLANMYLMLLTSLESRSDIVAGLDAGADDYLVKPFDPGELRARVNVGVRVLTLQERLADHVGELQDALANVKQLHGLLPICSYCKRIRGDDQYLDAGRVVRLRTVRRAVQPRHLPAVRAEAESGNRRVSAEEAGRGVRKALSHGRRGARFRSSMLAAFERRDRRRRRPSPRNHRDVSRRLPRSRGGRPRGRGAARRAGAGVGGSLAQGSCGYLSAGVAREQAAHLEQIGRQGRLEEADDAAGAARCRGRGAPARIAKTPFMRIR